MTVECDAVPAVAGLTATHRLLRTTVDDAALNIVYIGEVRTDGVLCPDTYTLTRTWETADCAGNVHSQSQTIEVQDTHELLSLSITCPSCHPVHERVPFARGGLEPRHQRRAFTWIDERQLRRRRHGDLTPILMTPSL